MTTNIVNQIAFLPTTKYFPTDTNLLVVEVNKTYVDIASAVNARTIGIFTTIVPSITGESWFLHNLRQQSLRQVYTFTTTADINIGFKLANVFQISNMHGVYKSGTAQFGLIPATSVAINGQISFYVDVNVASTKSDVIKFVVGGGAPALTSGTIILEWLSQV